MIRLILGCVYLSACGTSEPPTEPAPEPAATEVALGTAPPATSDKPGPAGQDEKRTTSCNIWMTNAKAALERAERHHNDDPSWRHKLELAQQANAWGRATASLEHIAMAEKLTTELLADKPDHAPAVELRLQARFTMHKLPEAREDLKRLEELGADAAKLDSWRSELQWLAGDAKAAEAGIDSSATDRSDIWTLSRRAAVHRAMGRFGAAAKDFEAAENAWTGTAPIPLTWLNVQRGLMELHRGDYPAAKVYFEAGYDRCPEYPMASEHLAEIEGRLGNKARSVELYRAVVEQTGDPEFLVALAEALDAPEEADEAKKLIERARTENLARLEKYPEAMYWHAAEFFLDAGNDPAKGLELLEKNMELRPNHESRVALAGALLDNGKADEAWKMVKPAIDDPLQDAETWWTAARIALALGKTDDAKGYEAKAIKLNPKIADLEGPLTGG